MTGIVLAGGRSQRFGSDKASALLAGRPLVQWVVDAVGEVCSEVTVVAAEGQVLPEVTAGVPVRIVRDAYLALGPLAGMVTGLGAAESDVCVVVSCDAPLVRPALLRMLVELLGDGDAACGEVGGRLQPLVAVYRASRCLEVFRSRVERGELSVVAALADLDVKVASALRGADPEFRSFLGVNTREDLAVVERLTRRG